VTKVKVVIQRHIGELNQLIEKQRQRRIRLALKKEQDASRRQEYDTLLN